MLDLLHQSSDHAQRNVHPDHAENDDIRARLGLYALINSALHRDSVGKSLTKVRRLWNTFDPANRIINRVQSTTVHVNR